MTVEHLDYIEEFVLDIFGNFMPDDFALIVGIENFLLHHTLAHGSHLGTVFRVDDGSHDVAAESGTNLIELFGVVLGDGFLVLVEADIHVEVADFEFRTVGSEAGVEFG